MYFFTRIEVFGYNNQFLVTIDHLVHNHGLLDFSLQSIKHSKDDIHIHINPPNECSLALVVLFPSNTFCFKIQKKFSIVIICGQLGGFLSLDTKKMLFSVKILRVSPA